MGQLRFASETGDYVLCFKSHAAAWPPEQEKIKPVSTKIYQYRNTVFGILGCYRFEIY